jgi:hypothetical protein
MRPMVGIYAPFAKNRVTRLEGIEDKGVGAHSTHYILLMLLFAMLFNFALLVPIMIFIYIHVSFTFTLLLCTNVPSYFINLNVCSNISMSSCN